MKHASENTDRMLSAAEHAEAMSGYVREGKRRVDQLGARGPLRFSADGALHPDILAAYWKHGFYVFENMIGADELTALRADADKVIQGAPVRKGANIDAQCRTAYGRQFAVDPYILIKPLSDPWGGTDVFDGRHPAQMTQPAPGKNAPEEVVHVLTGVCQTMPSALRLCGHPQLLTIAEAINGDDFVPYTEVAFVKQPGLGGSVAWHQDGATHWESQNWDEGIHGFNFQAQLYACTERNCLWVVPGTHKGRVDIAALVASNAGSELIPGAVPMVCEPGDVTIANRQILHGSFANTSPDMRVSITIGFNRRASVLGAQGALFRTADEIYDEKRVDQRSSVIALGIDARANHYPKETRFCYQPFAGREDSFRYDPETIEATIRDYNLNDLAI